MKKLKQKKRQKEVVMLVLLLSSVIKQKKITTIRIIILRIIYNNKFIKLIIIINLMNELEIVANAKKMRLIVRSMLLRDNNKRLQRCPNLCPSTIIITATRGKRWIHSDNT